MDMELDPEVDLSVGPNGERNFTEEELFIEATITHFDSFRPKYLIRSHNLKFKVNTRSDGSQVYNEIKPQDLVIKTSPGKSYIMRQHFGTEQYRESVKGTFVNGDKLTPQQNHILENGDIVSLGISHLHPKCKMNKGIFWIFKYREVSLEDEMRRIKLCSQIFENSVILSTIFNKFTDGLAELRIVSKLWNEVAIPKLKNQKEIVTKQLQNCYESNDSSEDFLQNPIKAGRWECWIQMFNEMTTTFNSLGLTSLNIDQSDIYPNKNRTFQVVNAFETFFRSYSDKILEITLNFYIKDDDEDGELGYDSIKKVLQCLFKNCSNLQAVNILGDFSEILKDIIVSSSPKILTIRNGLSDFEALFQKFPNTVKLVLADDDETYLQNMDTLAENSENIKKFWKNLKVFELTSVGHETAQILKKIPIKIEELILHMLFDEDDLSDDFFLAISGFCGCLKKLTLEFFCDSVLVINPQLRIPKMEKLEFLRIHTNQAALNFIWENQEKSFPNLKVINMELEAEISEIENQTFLQNLVTEENKKQFPKLEIAYWSYGDMRSKNYVSLKN